MAKSELVRRAQMMPAVEHVDQEGAYPGEGIDRRTVMLGAALLASGAVLNRFARYIEVGDRNPSLVVSRLLGISRFASRAAMVWGGATMIASDRSLTGVSILGGHEDEVGSSLTRNEGTSVVTRDGLLTKDRAGQSPELEWTFGSDDEGL